MKITRELLEEKGACRDGIAWFDKTFPDGTELDEEAVAKAAGCPTDFAWWLYNNVQQDARLYLLCGVNRSYGVNWSDGVNRSHGVNRSDGVNWSDGVNGSDGVNRSYGVNGSDGVNRSYGVNWSDGVNRSYGVNWSHGVNRSYGVNWSHGVNQSNGVNWSYGVNGSNGVNGSFGIHNCYGVDNALFLANKARRYSIFGKRVKRARFEEVNRKLYDLLGDWRPTYNNIKALWLANGSDWRLTPIKYARELSKQEAWAGMPQAAIDYVRSLPEFDADMFEEITGIATQKENPT